MEHTALDIFIDLIFIITLQLLGIYAHVMQAISKLCDKFPEKNRKEIIAIFNQEEWDSLRVSGIVLLIWVVLYIALHRYGMQIIPNIPWFPFSIILLSPVIGYCGQRLLYKVMGTAESVLNSKVDSFEKKQNG